VEKLCCELVPPNGDNHQNAGRPRTPYFAVAETNSGHSHSRVSKSEEAAALKLDIFICPFRSPYLTMLAAKQLRLLAGVYLAAYAACAAAADAGDDIANNLPTDLAP